MIAGSGPGTKPEVAVFSGQTGVPLETLSPFSASFTGGVSVAAGDVNGSGSDDVIAATGSGTNSVIRVFAGATRTRLASFSPYSAFTGGVSISAADLAGAGGPAELVTGPGPGGGSQVKVFAGTGALVASFLGATGSQAITVGAG